MVQQLDLFGAMTTPQVEKPKETVVEKTIANVVVIENKLEPQTFIEPLPTTTIETIYDVVKRKRGRPKKEKLQTTNAKIKLKRGRKKLTETFIDIDFNNVPSDEDLHKKQYYSISEVANWFNITNSQLRFWENEFDILKPKKNKKGNRLFRPEDVKSLKLIYFLLRKKKLSVQGAKDYLKLNAHNTNTNIQLQQSLQNFRSFLLELKATL